MVMVNNVVWHHDDTLIRHFNYGDYLKVDISTRIASAEDALLRLRYIEICNRQSRFFTDTPSSDGPDQQRSPAPGSEEERSRSRSRSGGNRRAPGNAEDATWDSSVTPPEDLVDAGDIGFNFTSFDMLPPPGNTSNEDSPVEPDSIVAHPEWISDDVRPGPRIDTATVFVIDDEGMEAEEAGDFQQASFGITLPADLHCVVSLLQPWHNTPLRL